MNNNTLQKNKLTNIDTKKLGVITDYRNKDYDYNKTTVIQYRIYRRYVRIY